MFRFPVLSGGSTMFDQLFDRPSAVARYRKGPLLEERVAFLTHLANQSYSRRSLQAHAGYLLAIAHTLGRASPPPKALTLAEVRRKMSHQRSLFPLAVRWLRFVGRLR